MFTSIDQSIARGDADIGLSGIEDTLTRRTALSLTVPYYEFREVLSVRTADASRFRTLADLRGRKSRHARAERSPTRFCCAPSATTASRRFRTTTTCIRTAIWCSGASTPCCSTTCSPNGGCGRCPVSRFSRTPSPSATTSACSRRTKARLRDACNEILRAAMRDGPSSASSASGASGTTTSRRCTPGCSRVNRSRRSSSSTRPAAGDRDAGQRGDCLAMDGDAPLSAVAPAGVGGHDRALVPVDGAGRGPRRAHRDGPRVRRPHAAPRAHRRTSS